YAAGRTLRPVVGALAVCGAALDPNLVAHASLATSDVAFACLTLATVLAAYRLAERPSTARSAVLGAALGAAFVAKVSAVLLLPGVCLVPLLTSRGRGAGVYRRVAALLLLSGIVAWAVVCGAYLLREIGRPLGALDLRSAFFLRLAAALPGLRLPLPAAFLTAFDASLASERGDWNVIVLGHRHPRGVPYYFLLMWVLKTPLLVAMAEIFGLARAALESAVRRHPFILLLAFNVLFMLGYFSLVFHAQIGYRYVLMLVPLAYVIAAAGLASLPSRPRWKTLGALVVLSALAENAAYLGNPLSFTNAAVQPKRDAYRLLADSNIDWGQNRERLPDWLAEREWNAARLNPVHLLPGRNVIGLNALAGVFDFEQYRWVREHLEPGGHLGHTYLWYLVDDETFNRFLYDSRRLLPEAFASTVCPDSLEYTVQPNGSALPFTRRRMPRPNETSIACVVARRDTDVAFRVDNGAADVGVWVAPGQCRTQALHAGEEVWWRLEPGTHALCVVTQPYRRTFLPYLLDGSWRVRGWSARIAVRPLIPEPTPPPPEATTPRSSSPPRPRAD
ncbi:MAG TPA: glycosyltransferase family 39 protein, partial [Vicinamibacteria bacterium]|nr:glycosyltransferase family 39 protein [Vicinamibacteria bacterium]